MGWNLAFTPHRGLRFGDLPSLSGWYASIYYIMVIGETQRHPALGGLEDRHVQQVHFSAICGAIALCLGGNKTRSRSFANAGDRFDFCDAYPNAGA